MTPGTYLRLRREAAAMSRDAVACYVCTEPPVPSRTRAEWIEAIEADVHRVPYAYVIAIDRAFSFDPAIIDALVQVSDNVAGAVVPALCRRCACSEFDPCVDKATHDMCAWVEPDLCSTCAAAAPAGVLELTAEQQLPPANGQAA